MSAALTVTSVAAIVGCTTDDRPTLRTGSSVRATTAPTGVGPSSSDVVDEAGATVRLVVDGVEVIATAPGGVAEPGTVFAVSADALPLKPFEAQTASSIPVRVTLGSGEQPKKPITLQFDVSDQPDLAAVASDSVLPVVRTMSDGDSARPDLLPVKWDDAAKAGTATTDHLSVFELIFANVGHALGDAVKAFQSQPDHAESPCRDHSKITIGATTYTLTPSQPGPVVACLNDTGKGIGVDFANTTTQYYGVVSSPDGNFTNPPPPQLPSDEQLAVWLRGDVDGRTGLLTPQGTGQLVLPADLPHATVRLDADPIALQLKTILTGIGMLGVSGDDLVTYFEGAAAAWDCVAAAFNRPGASTAAFADALSDMSQCGLAGARAQWGRIDDNNVLHRMGVAVSLISALPHQLVANVEGMIGEITGNNHLAFTLTSEGPPEDGPPTGGGTLVPLIIKTHGSPADSGQELGPNQFQLGPILKDDSGRNYVSLKMRWKTSDGEGIATYCNEFSKIVDKAGNTVVERKQRLAVCDNGGNWSFDINTPGTYTYVLEVAPEGGEPIRAEQRFVVVS